MCGREMKFNENRNEYELNKIKTEEKEEEKEAETNRNVRYFLVKPQFLVPICIWHMIFLKMKNFGTNKRTSEKNSVENRMNYG